MSALCIASLVACSGGGTSSPVANGSQTTPTTSPASKTAKATISIVIPLAERTATGKRSRKYVSPNTQSFGIAVTSNNGTPISNPPFQYVDVTPTSPGCSSDGTVLTCTSTVNVPVGNDVLIVDAWSGTDGSGAILSSNQVVDAAIAGTKANTIPLTLNPVATNVTVLTSETNGDPQSGPLPGAPTTETLQVTAKDCTGATIVGPGSYVDPITLTLTEVPNKGTVSISETTVKTPSDVVFLKWTGSASTQYASIAPYVAPYQQGCGNAYNYLTTGYFLPSPQPPYLWTSQLSSSGATGEYGWLVGYPVAWIEGASGAGMRPGMTIESPGVGFYGVTADHAGDVFTFNQPASNASYETSYDYAPGVTFDALAAHYIIGGLQPPGATIQNPANVTGIASDPGGTLYELYAPYGSSTGNEPAGIQSLVSPYSSATAVYSNTGNFAWPYSNYAAPNPIFVDKNDNTIIGFEPVANPNVPSFIGVEQGGSISTVQPAGDPEIGGVWSDGTTVYASTDLNGTISVVSYLIAGILAGAPIETTVFTTSNAVTAVPQGQNAFVRDANGYYYLMYFGNVYVFAPTATGTNVAPVVTFQNGNDPTTTSNQMVVPSNLVPPGNGANAIAITP